MTERQGESKLARYVGGRDITRLTDLLRKRHNSDRTFIRPIVHRTLRAALGAFTVYNAAQAVLAATDSQPHNWYIPAGLAMVGAVLALTEKGELDEYTNNLEWNLRMSEAYSRVLPALMSTQGGSPSDSH